MEQQFDIAGHVFKLIAPADVDAVMDMYIAQGKPGTCSCNHIGVVAYTPWHKG